MRQCETEKGPKQMVEGCRSGVILPGAPTGEVSSRKNERKLSESGRIGWMISKQGTLKCVRWGSEHARRFVWGGA
jgi:hypothetical protein